MTRGQSWWKIVDRRAEGVVEGWSSRGKLVSFATLSSNPSVALSGMPRCPKHRLRRAALCRFRRFVRSRARSGLLGATRPFSEEIATMVDAACAACRLDRWRDGCPLPYSREGPAEGGDATLPTATLMCCGVQYLHAAPGAHLNRVSRARSLLMCRGEIGANGSLSKVARGCQS